MKESPIGAGSVLFLGGSAGLMLTALSGPLGWSQAARVFAAAEPLWYGMFLLMTGVGAYRLWSAGHAGTSWQPTRRGRRFETVVLYTRKDCHLCEVAKELLEQYSRYLPPWTEVDIDEDPQLLEQFDLVVPVVAIDGHVRFKGRVDEILLRRLIEGTPPLDV